MHSDKPKQHLRTELHAVKPLEAEHRLNYEGRYESNASIFSLENIIATTMKFIWMICTSFAITGLFFYKVSVTFNTLLPTLSKTLCTGVVKFPASTSEHITETLNQFVVIRKMAPT
jgi:hypothetical protein